ncbi:uracil-DNA glycosylase [Rhinolophus gammaherpesvirus 1]|uniref:Uracil-DNA glycosylase n=1 Tax=Rhinolophus gammaherpesvirus 1 TaxID=2054179 RepID=A0A2Z5U6C7_9GAMA|nr:uracil-DNA glycosylase [Rhinolophus gammaherpesvirus 1]BBB06494.1 uracil-DNA glycosylase [Rhinolophus gammaherpesvirus 1]
MEKWLQLHAWSAKDDQEVAPEKLMLSPQWLEFLQMSPFLQKKLLSLLQDVSKLRAKSIVYPDDEHIMRWSFMCHPTEVKVVILGQDPYHGGQATGLAFSVSREFKIPPSLKNIFSEISRSDASFSVPVHGCLDNWARQGVLLLNTILTVEKGKAGSHSDLGWIWFTNYIISCLSNQLNHCVFLLWGSRAIEKASLIDSQKHLVLRAQHPSPLAANSTRPSNWPKFSGCDHFTQANNYLKLHQKTCIDWNLD